MTDGLIVVDHLQFTYAGEKKPALSGINLEIKQGEFVLITGPSGCGKSTLTLCMTGFIPHGYSGDFQGKVLVKGQDTLKTTPEKLAGIVGMVRQDPETQLCTLKVAEEVAFGPENLCLPPGEIKKRVYRSLNIFEAEKLLERNTYFLSGGEKQRVAIASVLAMTPSVLILDEPTANLDPRCSREVLKAIAKLHKELNTTIIVIEHRIKELLPLCDRIIVMDGGRIVADDRPERAYFKYSQIKYKKKKIRPCLKEPTCFAKENPLLSVNNLSVARNGISVLTDINFNLYPGEIMAVMGDNGSGKTSLFLALLGMLKSKGSIFLKGKDISNLDTFKRARYMGLIFQNPNHQIFENTVMKEAQLACSILRNEKCSISRLKILLEEFGLLSYKGKIPQALSMGEKKRLTLVSVLAYEPDILFLDEPLAGQDMENVDLLFGKLRDYCLSNKSVMITCHSPDVAFKYCDRILFLAEGRLIFDAPPDKAKPFLKKQKRSEYLPSREMSL